MTPKLASSPIQRPWVSNDLPPRTDAPQKVCIWPEFGVAINFIVYRVGAKIEAYRSCMLIDEDFLNASFSWHDHGEVLPGPSNDAVSFSDLWLVFQLLR